ncbi:MAG: 50S ribosomal protein L6 [Crenarchaeota archaeon]|nr:50S ribosomal protein L6 [Thermoproteota archaeon]
MKVPYVREEVEIPPGVDVQVESNGRLIVKVKGPLGELVKDFGSVPIMVRREDNKLVLETYFARKFERALVGTIASRIRNMIKGVTKGWRYKLKIVYSHFPIMVKVQGDKLIIENLLGRKDKIVLQIPKGIKVQVTKDDIIVEGIDRDLVSQFAANIEEATTLRGDERPCPHGREGGPGVLDGIYVYAVEHVKA